jgi:hypothetical protein
MQEKEKEEEELKKDDNVHEKIPSNEIEAEEKDILQYNQKMIPKPRMMP